MEMEMEKYCITRKRATLTFQELHANSEKVRRD